MARNLSEVLGPAVQEHYAKEFISNFPKTAGTPPEYVAIAADAYGVTQARKVEDLRVSTKVVDFAERARATGADPSQPLIKAAENAVYLGKNKVIGTTPVEVKPTGAKVHVIVTLEQLIHARELQEYRQKASQRPTGVKRA